MTLMVNPAVPRHYQTRGHGFGLHSAACAAGEMGGEVHIDSEGAGMGATFSLDLPTIYGEVAIESDAETPGQGTLAG